MRLLFSLVALFVSLFLASAASAATLIVNGSGILTGATGVNVGGTLYDVAFVEGTCIALFGGCDSVNDFDFTTEADAVAASQALLDQVFLDAAQGEFNADPGLTSGCINTTFGVCEVWTPFGFGELAGESGVLIGAAENDAALGFDTVFVRVGSPDTDSSTSDEVVFARWTPSAVPDVPEPASLTLLGLGIAGIGVRRWRQRKGS